MNELELYLFSELLGRYRENASLEAKLAKSETDKAFNDAEVYCYRKVEKILEKIQLIKKGQDAK